MNILAFGDIYGSVGKEMLEKHLSKLQTNHDIDFTIVNAENISRGKSITLKDYNFLKNLKVDAITMGNHVWFEPEAHELVKKELILRPQNMSDACPGTGTKVFKIKNKSLRVTNIIGRTFMEHYDNPFFVFEKILKDSKEDIHIVDFHAEATAEKTAFAWLYDGKISMLYGSHTHVQTNDERILNNGTGYLSDIGMTGPFNSIIGAEPLPVINRMRTGMPAKFSQALGEGQLCAIVINICDSTNKVLRIKKIFLSPQRNEIN